MSASGNFIIDMYEKEEARREREDEEFCYDCDCSPCRCDEIQEKIKED